MIKAIENLDPDFYIYKGAEFWKDAALQYLRTNVLKKKVIDSKKDVQPPQYSKEFPISLRGVGILTAGATITLLAGLAFGYIKKKS